MNNSDQILREAYAKGYLSYNRGASMPECEEYEAALESEIVNRLLGRCRGGAAVHKSGRGRVSPRAVCSRQPLHDRGARHH